MKKPNLFKKILISGLALSMIVGGTAAFATPGGNGKGKIEAKGKGKSEIKLEFKDVGADFSWASKHIASLAAKKVFNGYEDGSFKPNKPVNRIEAIATAIRLMDLKAEAESEAVKKTELTFADAKHIAKKYSWATGYLALAVEHNLLLDTEGNFNPEKPADRLWVATVLIKALGLESEAQAKMNAELTFKDAEEIPAESVGYVALAVEKGITIGYENNTFRPNRPVKRAELAAFLNRSGEHLPDPGQDNNGEGAVRGTVTADVYSNTLTILKGDQTLQLTLDPNAFIFREDAKVTASDLEIGDEVLARSYNNVVIFVEVTKTVEEGVNANITGTLNTAVVANKLSIKKADNTDVEYELAANATFQRSGVAVDASALKAGDEVVAVVQNSKIIYVQVTKTIEEQQFTVNGLYHSMTLNTEGKISSISIEQAQTGGGTQVSNYTVAANYTIIGNLGLMVLNQPVELKGEDQLVTSIEIK